MRHEMLTQCNPFCHYGNTKKGHAESAFHDACRTSSGVFHIHSSLVGLSTLGGLVVTTHLTFF
jgi:hypothetical protein